MKIKYNIEIIKKIIGDLEKLTGMTMNFLDSERNAIYKNIETNDYCSVLQKNNCKSNDLCRECDDKILQKCSKSKKLEYHNCHAGLCDAAMPIIKNGKTVGFVIFGRIKGPNSPEASKYISNNGELETLYKNIPTFSREQILSFHDLLSHIFFEKTIEIENLTLIERATDYIENNLQKDLSLSFLCRVLNTNRNTLYSTIKEFYNKTVVDFVIDKRIEKVKELLIGSDRKIYDIASECGIDNYSYFCKLFKSRVGVSPTEYRKGRRWIAPPENSDEPRY